MFRQTKTLIMAGAAALTLTGAARAASLTIVAAENVYGDLARQIGGPDVKVTSILSNPDQDPHLFEADPSTARALSSARIVILNGIDYDPWMDKLLKADAAPGRTELVAGDIVGKKVGDNPHLWYDPDTMSAMGKSLTASLSSADPAHADRFAKAAAAFETSLTPVREKVAAMKAKYAGLPVTASEPVFGYMADALGLDMRNKAFQQAVMNNTEPGASDVAAFEDDLKAHKVKVMIYNSQAADTAAKRLLGIANASGVPVLAVTETEPAGQGYAAWMLAELDGLEKALDARQ